MIKSQIIVLLICCCASLVCATEQAPERLIYQGDTVMLFALPLEVWPSHTRERPSYFPDSLNTGDTGCWRGYIGEWEIKDGYLYLINLYNCDRTARVNLADCFPQAFRGGGIKADWFTDTVKAQYGRHLYNGHSGFSAVYEHELEFVIDSGRIRSVEYFDNSRSKNLHHAHGYDMQIVDSLIDWSNLPTIQDTVRTLILAIAGKTGRADSVWVAKGHSDPFDREALRVSKLLDKFPVIYRRGKPTAGTVYVLPLVFTEEKQQKYRKCNTY